MAFEYNLNIQVWRDDDGSLVYHVFQEHEDGDPEVLVYGIANTKREALREIAPIVMEELSNE